MPKEGCAELVAEDEATDELEGAVRGGAMGGREAVKGELVMRMGGVQCADSSPEREI